MLRSEKANVLIVKVGDVLGSGPIRMISEGLQAEFMADLLSY